MTAKKKATAKQPKPESVPMESVALYKLTWVQSHPGKHGFSSFRDFSVTVELDAALSLYAALETNQGFQSVVLERSPSRLYRTPAEPAHEGADKPEGGGA